MRKARALRLAVLAGWLAANGCMTLNEIPRSELGARAERNRIRVETIEGLLYEFDYATFQSDTLTGYRSRPDIDGPVDQVSQVRLPFDQLSRVSSRQLDWRRTGMVGGGVVATALAVGLHSIAKHDNTPNTSSGGGRILPP